MSNFIAQFKAAARVSTPIVAIRTFDASSAISAIKGSYGDKVDQQGLVLWDCVQGCRPLNDKGKTAIERLCAGQEGGVAATVMLENTLWFAEKGWAVNKGDQKDNVLFVSNAHLFMAREKPAIIQGIWNLRNVLKANGHMCVLLMAPGATLPQELVNDVLVLDEPLPTRDELGALVVKHHGMVKAPAPDKIALDRAVDALVGLPMFGADQSTAMSLSGKTKKLDMDELWAKKREIISQTPGLSIWNGKDTLASIGGSEQVIEFYRAFMEGPKAPNVILFLDEVEKMFAGSGSADGHKGEQAGQFQTWTEDQGVMGGAFVGIPGCGKTQIAKGIAGTYEKPLIIFDVAGMQDKHVGETNARMRAAFKTVEAVSGGKGRVLMIGTSNGMGNLPLGLRRRFEFAPMFFFDVPTRVEKDAIWKIQLDAYNLPGQKLPQDLGWTGAEIRNCCSKAEALGVSVSEAAKWVIPVVQSEAGRILAMRHEATGKMLSASVPGTYHFNESEKEVFGGDVIEDSERRIKE